MLKKHLSLIGKLHAAGVSCEKHGVQAVLKLADGFADGRLADVELLCRTGNIPGLGYSVKDTVL